MGNDISGHGLKLQKQLASAGPGHLWKIYEAKRTAAESRSAGSAVAGQTDQQISLWVFDKREFADKARLEGVITKLKTGFQHLSRLKHPNILRVISPLREDKSYLSFETEPIFASLSNLLKNYTNLSPVPQAIEHFANNEALELKMGLFQLTNAVQFLHRSANLIHLNICPESVIVAADGAWKLAGFEFSFYSNYKPGGATSSEMFHANEFDSKANFSGATLPNLDFLGPEVVFIRRFDYASDIFSLGCLIYLLFAQKPLISAQHNVLSYKQRIEGLVPLDFSRIPQDGHETLQALLSVDIAKRMDADGLLSSAFFGDILLRSLMFADSLANKEAPLKAKFFKGLQRLVPKYSHRLLKLRLLPPLLRELRFPEQVPFIIPSIFAICGAALTDKEFREVVLPCLLPLFNKDAPNSVQIAISLLENMEFFIQKSPEAVVGTHVIPLICWSMNCGDANLQDIAIRQVPVLGSKIPYSSLLSTILPRMISISVSNSHQVSPVVRTNSLICLGKLYVSKVIDQKVVVEKVLPALETSLVTQCTPDIFAATMRVYLVISKKLDEVVVARKVLPTLLPLLTDPILERELFEKLTDLIQELVQKVRNWRLNAYLTQEQLEREISSTLSETDELSRLHVLVNQNAPQKAATPLASTIPPSNAPPRSPEEIQYEYVKKREEVFMKKQEVEAKLADKHQQLQSSVSALQSAPASTVDRTPSPSSFSADQDDPYLHAHFKSSASNSSYESSPFSTPSSSFPTSVGSGTTATPKPTPTSTNPPSTSAFPTSINSTSTFPASSNNSTFPTSSNNSTFPTSIGGSNNSTFGFESSEPSKPKAAAPSSTFPLSSGPKPPTPSSSPAPTSSFPLPSAPSSTSAALPLPPVPTPMKTTTTPSPSPAPLPQAPKASLPQLETAAFGGNDMFSSAANPPPSSAQNMFDFFSASQPAAPTTNVNSSSSPFGDFSVKPQASTSKDSSPSMSFFPQPTSSSTEGASPFGNFFAAQPAKPAEQPSSFFEAPPAIDDAALALKVNPSFLNAPTFDDKDPFDVFF